MVTTLGVMLPYANAGDGGAGEWFPSRKRGQVEQMGRWKEKYDTVNSEVSIVPIIVPGGGTLP